MPETFWAAVETVPTSQDACDQLSGTWNPFCCGTPRQGGGIVCIVQRPEFANCFIIVASLSCFPIANMPLFAACGWAGI